MIHPDIAIPFSLAAAPLVGSFVGVVAARTGTGESALLGRSRCDHCRRTLGARDLVPLVSWMAQRGRARCCGVRLSIGLPLVELAAIGVAIWAVLAVPFALLPLSLLLGWTLLALAAIDRATWRLPDIGTLGLTSAGLALAGTGTLGPVADHLIGAALGYGAFALVGAWYHRRTGRDGLGLGDAKLLAAAGAWLGWTALPGVLLIACAAAFTELLLRRFGGEALNRRTAMQFGPGLALGFWAAWLHGPLILVGP